MLNNPIVQRELKGILRTRKSFAIQTAMAVSFSLLVILRWPTDGRADLAGEESRQLVRAFGYGLLVAMILLVPIFPSASIVREKRSGTLALLLNSPMSPTSIYLGKLVGVMCFVLVLLIMSLPAAAACFAMGGVSLTSEIGALYVLLILVALQYTVLGLLVSIRTNTVDSALRVTYACILGLAVFTLGPNQLLQGQQGLFASLGYWIRMLSPIPAVMEIMGHGDFGSEGFMSPSGGAFRYAVTAIVTSIAGAIYSVRQLNHTLFDRAREQGIITDDLPLGRRILRRLVFIIDPQRRKTGISWFMNPILMKEFRTRRFGRFHWLLRLVAVCAMISLLLTFAALKGAVSWDVEKVGALLVVMQVALILMITPSLAAGLISSEHESGGWQLLQMTPLSVWRILSGKLLSVTFTLALILLATLPGYLFMIKIKPAIEPQVERVLICLVLTAVFAMVMSAAVSSLFRRTAPATTTSYLLLLTICAGTLLFWLGRDAPFGHTTVETMLKLNPMAAALSVINAPGFEPYRLIPHNWYVIGSLTVVAFLVLTFRTWRLTRPR